MWIRGSLAPTNQLWKDWFDTICSFADVFSINITHIGGSSVNFRSGKYVSFRHVRKRLEAAISNNEYMTRLSFISVVPPFITMAQDQRFGACLSITGPEAEILVQIQDGYFPDGILFDFEKRTLPFYSNARIEHFKVDRSDLPINYVMNFGNPSGLVPRGFASLQVREYNSNRG